MQKEEWMQKYKKALIEKKRSLKRLRTVNRKLSELAEVLASNGW